MIDLIDVVEITGNPCNGSLLCESFRDPRLYQIHRSLQLYGLNFKDIFKYNLTAWDKIDSSDIEEIDNINNTDFDTMLKAVRKVIAGKDERPFVIFAMKDEELKYVYNPVNSEIAVFSWDSYRRKNYCLWYHQGNGKQPYTMTQSEQFAHLRKCEYLLKVYIDAKNTRALKMSRVDAKANMLPDLTHDDHHSMHTTQGELGKNQGGLNPSTAGAFYTYCMNTVNQARKKWKTILAENKFKRDQDTSEVDNAVQDIMNRLPKAMMNITKNPEKYGDNVKYEVENLMKLVYDKYSSHISRGNYIATGRDEILVQYQQYCQLIISLKLNNSYDVAQEVQRKDNYKKSILVKCRVVSEILKKFNA